MRGIVRSLCVSLWFMFLTFPLLVIKVSPLTGGVQWNFMHVVYLGIGIFFLSFVWRGLLVKKGIMSAREADLEWFFTAIAEAPYKKDLFIGGLLGVGGCVPLIAVVGTLGGTAFAASLGNGVFSSWVVVALALLGLAAFTACWRGRREEVYGRTVRFFTGVTQPGLPRRVALGLGLLLVLPLPFLVDMYQVNILTSAFIWIMLGLGLNIVVGQAGLLVLGYAAFYAVGAYAYALLNLHYSGDVVGFWLALPLGGALALVAGVLLSLPVLRLRGDYLAIVTLGFGEIVRVILEGGSLSFQPLLAILPEALVEILPGWMHNSLDMGGPAGISNIPYPGFFGMQMSMDASIRYVYFIALGMTIITIAAVARLRDSRLGRSWMALREDEIACEAMGINKVAAKLSAFALGACWAGFGGVLFAAKTSFINPTSFTFMESVLILSVVVLGGLGSILGVALGACVLILLPEYLRFLNEYRMLIFGASMVLMMVFRPQGLITPQAKRRVIARKAARITRVGGEV